jgi:hypothetical protein
MLYCNVGDEIEASSCCKKDGDVLILMLRLEFVRRGFLVGLLIDKCFSASVWRRYTQYGYTCVGAWIDMITRIILSSQLYTSI